MLAVFAEFERSTYIDRMQGAKRAKAAAGGYVGGPRLARRYGYRLESGEYLPVPAEQVIIGQMRERYTGGDTLAAVAAWLSGSDAQTSTGRDTWSAQAVAAILRREGVALRPRGRQPVAV